MDRPRSDAGTQSPLAFGAEIGQIGDICQSPSSLTSSSLCLFVLRRELQRDRELEQNQSKTILFSHGVQEWPPLVDVGLRVAEFLDRC